MRLKRAKSLLERLGSLLLKCGGPGSGVPGPCPAGGHTGGDRLVSEGTPHLSAKSHKAVADQIRNILTTKKENSAIIWSNPFRNTINVTTSKNEKLLKPFAGNDLDAAAIQKHIVSDSGNKISVTMRQGFPLNPHQASGMM